ncbi:MAG TPA: hypothetical protein V6D25_31280 [Leptolyngbyaceae cyanobacterium]
MGQVCTEKSSGFIPQFTQHKASPVDFSSGRSLAAWILSMQVNIAWRCDDRGDRIDYLCYYFYGLRNT